MPESHVGAFQIDGPAPDAGREVHALVTLRPWVDVGRVGRHTLIRVERFLDAQEIGKLARPGDFYDFSRYRPRVMNVGVERRVTVPNTTLLYAQRDQLPDLLFLHLLEPHIQGEDFVESVLGLLKHYDVKRYTQVGGVSDAVPHTRPLLVTGTGPQEQVDRFGIQRSNYQGPTSIVSMISIEAQKMGIESMNMLVRLPHYAQLDEDYSGVARLLEILCELYGLPDHLIDRERGSRQYRQVDEAVAKNPQAESLIRQLESTYDAETQQAPDQDVQPLSPEVQRFLQEMDERLGDGPA